MTLVLYPNDVFNTYMVSVKFGDSQACIATTNPKYDCGPCLCFVCGRLQLLCNGSYSRAQSKSNANGLYSKRYECGKRCARSDSRCCEQSRAHSKYVGCGNVWKFERILFIVSAKWSVMNLEILWLTMCIPNKVSQLSQTRKSALQRNIGALGCVIPLNELCNI